jgi:hypothetical protein
MMRAKESGRADARRARWRFWREGGREPEASLLSIGNRNLHQSQSSSGPVLRVLDSIHLFSSSSIAITDPWIFSADASTLHLASPSLPSPPTDVPIVPSKVKVPVRRYCCRRCSGVRWASFSVARSRVSSLNSPHRPPPKLDD